MSTAVVDAPERREELPIPDHLRGAMGVLVRGLRRSPELRVGLGFTVVVSLAAAIAGLVPPILIQQVFDHGFTGGFRPRFVYGLCGAAFALVAASYVAGRAAARRLARASEAALTGLRVQAFEHIHRLSTATQTRERRGVFVARVTADVDTLSEFTEWGGIAWIVSVVQIVGALVVMLVYSWQLTIPVVVLVLPLVLVVARLQGRLSQAYDLVRGRVGQMLSEVSESVMGAAVVRAYGLEERVDSRVKRSIRERYEAQRIAHLRTALLFPTSTIFWGVALAVVIAVGAGFGPGWGLTFGTISAFLFLADLFLHPFSDLPEIYADTQTAISGWRKILALLELPVEIREATPGVALPHGALEVRTEDVSYRYGNGPLVVHGISLEVPPGAHVAIVGETGSGKTTFVKLLARLADPVGGRILVGGVDLREVARASRQGSIRMVPQDGFLFDLTIRENVRAGRGGASDREVEAAFEELGLGAWLAALPRGLDTPAGERGESLSVGERQLVSLARAQLGEPGVLILDEATSAVDPAAERRISEALRRLSAGRTSITIAHRLSTAERADAVFVFDRGRVVERGTHAELVRAGGHYSRLYRSWLGNVRPSPAQSRAGSTNNAS
ncbi:MAG TPA: ABC transporter ATP-binding protein [Actinomycetota bacterium]